MSIIERFAQLLEPVGESKPRPSAHGKAPGTPELELIERAIASELAIAPAGAKQMAERTPAPAFAQAANKPARNSRTVAVDGERLRQRGMIVPGVERTATAESFRRIKRRILANALNSNVNAPANLVLVTSAHAGEGKTFCAINLAISIASEVDHSVLLVDADVRKPSIPDVFGLRAEKGLMDLLVDRGIDMADVLYRTDIGKLTLLPAGTAQEHATELLASGATRDLLRGMAARYRDRIILFDSPPLLTASEAGVLASQMGQVVVVVESGRTTESALKEALSLVDSTHLTGLVLNKDTGLGLGTYYRGHGNGA
jgi:exopolysaccharide/PEP-CTERM locus tyrosine autokinase